MWAQVLINESFQNSTTTAFTLRNNALLTANSGGGTTDAEGQGYLRLTSGSTNQRGAVISNTAFPAIQGFNISFEFFAYTQNTTGADGFSVFLIDGATPVANFVPGAFGSSLGYAPATVGSPATTTPGATNGYLGIGLDEYGGFNTNFEGRTGGGTAYVRNTVAIRGDAAGNYALLTPVLTASNTGSSLGVATPRAQSTSADYRRATISVTPTGGTYRIMVRIQNGTGLTTAISSFLLPKAPPATLRLGLAASTGSLTNTHEIRNLYVVVPPTAQDDEVVTPNNTPITVDVLGNDNPANSSFDYSTLDLDPNTIAIDQTLSVTGGTFQVNSTTGTVTFTPANKRSEGTYAVSYLVSTKPTGSGTTAVPATPTNPATLTVEVGGQGTDIATSVSGPTTVTPGSTISYTFTTTNIGTNAANTVRPTLTLEQNLVVAGTLPAGASYANGVVTFPSTSTLAARGAVSYSVSFVAPATQSTVTATGTATTTSTDVQPNNNNGTTANSIVTTDVSRPASTTTPGPLPVELTTFQATAKEEAVLLTWRTASEVNNAYFTVERSTDGASFQPIGQVTGQGTTTRATAYRYQDVQAGQVGASLLYYRLRQVDQDGTANLSPVQAVQPRAAGPIVFQCYPNPMREQVTLDLSTLPARDGAVLLYDMMGRSVYQQTVTGGQQHLLALPTLPAGSYLLRVHFGDLQQTKLLVRE